MDKIEEFRVKLQCQKCRKAYNAQRKTFMYSECKHHTCGACLAVTTVYAKRDYTCPICQGASPITSNPLFQEVPSLIDECITAMKEKQIWETSTGDKHECVECKTKDSEQNMHLCESCHGLKFENQEDVKKNALCSTCTIKKHMRQGHQTVDFYPYLSAFNFSSNSSNIKSKSEQLKNVHSLMKKTVSEFDSLATSSSEWYDVLTDMTRRSMSTKHQIEFTEKMDEFIDEITSIQVEADSELKDRTKMLQESLTKIKEWHESKMGYCVDESKTIKLEIPANSNNDRSDSDS